jgi:hypothetical protein
MPRAGVVPGREEGPFAMFVAQTGLTDLYTVNPDGTGLY